VLVLGVLQTVNFGRTVNPVGPERLSQAPGQAIDAANIPSGKIYALLEMESIAQERLPHSARHNHALKRSPQ
jgi:hypothetical protein